MQYVWSDELLPGDWRWSEHLYTTAVSAPAMEAMKKWTLSASTAIKKQENYS